MPLLLIPTNMDTNKKYTDWIILRNNNPDKCGHKLCYCGHTKYCECANPDLNLFQESVKRGTIILGDKNNGWKKHTPK